MREAPESDAQPWGPGLLIAGRYEIQECLGTGGMGVVYRAHDIVNQRGVALKTIRGDLDTDSRAMVSKLLRGEIEALRRVESDFVVRIFEANTGTTTGFPGDVPFVVMELLRGRDLERVLKEDGPMSPSSALPLLWQAACGLKAIHARDVVHRDFKPANLYVRIRDDGTTELKILDFSISRLLDAAGGRKTTMIVGTRGFMAPEQAAGYDVDHRADLFALGQVARAMLMGDGGAVSKEAEFPVAAFLVWHAKATASDRRNRFASAPEAIAELANVLGLPFSSERPRGSSMAGTREAIVALGAPARGLVLALGLAAIALSIFLVLRRAPRSERSVPAVASAALTPLFTSSAVVAPEPLPSVARAVTPLSVSEAASASGQSPAHPRSVPRKPSASAAPQPPNRRPSDEF